MPQGKILTERQVSKILGVRTAGKTHHQIASLVKCLQGAIKNLKAFIRLWKEKTLCSMSNEN